jgi:hypothetical protein
LKDYGYAGIDDSSNVRHLLKGIKTTKLDVCKTQVMAIPSLHDDFSATVELYSTFIKQMKSGNPRLNVSEVSFARGKTSKNSFGKRNSSGISNVSNAAVYDMFFEKHECHALTPDQNNTIRLKCFKSGHVEKAILEMAMAMERTAVRDPHSNLSPATKIDKFSLPDDDDDEEE